MNTTMLVRLKPYDRSRGHVLRSYTIQGIRFQERRGWYEVEKEIADLVAKVKQPPVGNTPADLSPPAFDVLTKAEAVAHEEQERKAKEERARAIEPHRLEGIGRASDTASTLTSADLPKRERVGSESKSRPRGKRPRRAR